jgi:hypothetical protein
MNNIKVQEKVHILNRMNELENANASINNVAATASGAVLCFTGLDTQTANVLSKVWVD